MESNNGRGSLTNRYLTALLAPAVIAGVMQVTWPFFQHNPVLPYLLAVIFCAWYGGLGPGLLSVVISFLLTDFFFVEPYFFFWFPKQVDLVRLLLFAVVVPFISVMSELMHRARRRAGINLESAKRAERSLREKERFANQIAELSPVVINVFDLATRRDVYISPDVVNLLGYTPKEIAEMEDPFSVLWHPEDIPRASENLARLKHARDGEIAEFEYRLRRRDGEWRWVATRGISFERDEHGEVRQIVTATLDITERKYAEDALREAERQYRSIFENAGEGIFQSTPDGRFIAANPTLARMFGFASPAELIHGRQDISRQLYVDPSRREEFKRRVEEQGAVRGIEQQVFRKDGSKIWISVNARVVRDEQGQIQYYEGAAQDITDRKRAEEELRESEERYRDLVENSHDLICTHDLDGLVLSANRATMEIMGYSSGSYVGGINLREILAPEVRDQFDNYLKRIRADGVASGLMLVQTRTGEKRIWEYRNTLRTQGVSAPIVRGMARDITERKRAEEAISDLRRELELTMNSMEEGVHRVNLQGDIVFENPAAARMLGWEGAELLGKRAHPMMHHTRQDGTPYPTEECPIHATFRDGVTRQVADEVFWRRDGTSFPVEYMAAPMRNDRNEIVAAVVTFRDITERKQAEEIVRSSEQRLRNVIDGLGPETFVGLMTPDGTLIEANKSALAAAGLKPGDVLGKPFEQTYWWAYSEPVQQQLRDAIERAARGEASRYDAQVRVAENQFIVIDFSLQPLRDETGKVVFLVPSANVITERKRAEDQLRQAKDFSENLIQTANVIILGLDVEGNINIFNQTAEEITGYTAAELKGRSWFETLVPRDRYPYVWEEFIRVAGGWMSPFENPILTKSGEERYIMWQNNQVRVDGKVVATISFGNDITERKRAEEALGQSEERFSKAFHSSPAALSIGLLEDGRLLEVNAAFLRMTGYTREEVIGRTTGELGLWTSHYRRAMAEALHERGAVENLEIKFRKKSGEIRDGLLSAELIRLGAVPSVLGIAQDVTERKRAEETLRSYSRQLIEAQEAERQHIARELHDQIGQVLTAVRVNLQTIGNSCETAESRSLIDQGVALTDAALEQVRDLSFELRPSLLDNLGLVAALRWYSDQYAKRTGIRTKSVTNLPEGQTRLSHELETACFRIVQEALTNVVRHANAKNVSIDLRRLDHKIVLSIKDDGIGFDELSANGGASATRLGLMGMKERALALGGTLKIESAPAQGTKIRAYFPTESKED